MKVFQIQSDQEIVHEEFTEKELVMKDDSLSLVAKKIISTLKEDEIVSTIAKSEYITKLGEDLSERYPNFIPDSELIFDIALNKICKVTNLWNDGSTFYRSLRKGEGSASPYKDSLVVLKVKLEVDGETKFCHEEPLETQG